MVTTNIINLDNYRHLFRDEEAFDEFAEILRSSMEQELRPIICHNRVIGSALSAGGTKDFLYDRMVKRMTQRPEILDELADRIENDEVVD